MRHGNQLATSEAIGDLFRAESPRVLATLVRLIGDLDRAEDAMQDAFAVALRKWPEDGIPTNPAAWLITTARFKAIDAIRRASRTKAPLMESEGVPDFELERVVHVAAQPIEDDRLRLIFLCCHPALPEEGQIALTLREVCGLRTEEIASAFLTSTQVVAQRIVRCKARIRKEQISYELPEPAALPERLESVLKVTYLVFNEGYYASSGDSLTRRDLSGEAIRVGRLLAELLPAPEVVGLLALMLLQESRRDARSTPAGDLILLDDQNRSLWDRGLIEEGSELLERSVQHGHAGRYALQAAIALVHAESKTPEETNWSRIAELYHDLMKLVPSPVVELNLAVAIGMRDGPAAGLERIDVLLARGGLTEYGLAHSTRADFCRRLGQRGEALVSYKRALELATLAPERRFLAKRIEEMAR